MPATRSPSRSSVTSPSFFGSPNVSRPPMTDCSVVIGISSAYQPSVPSWVACHRERSGTERRQPGRPRSTDAIGDPSRAVVGPGARRRGQHRGEHVRVGLVDGDEATWPTRRRGGLRSRGCGAGRGAGRRSGRPSCGLWHRSSFRPTAARRRPGTAAPRRGSRRRRAGGRPRRRADRRGADRTQARRGRSRRARPRCRDHGARPRRRGTPANARRRCSWERGSSPRGAGSRCPT